jgi:hypothetical protein
MDNSGKKFSIPLVWGEHLPTRIEFGISKLIGFILGLCNQGMVDSKQNTHTTPGIINAYAELDCIVLSPAKMTGKPWPKPRLLGPHYGLSAGLSFFHGILHDAQLPNKQHDLTNNGANQQKGYKYKSPRGYSEPPFIRRFMVALLFIPFGFGAAFLGGKYLHDQRYALGAALAGVAWLFFCAGLGLILMNWWPATWEWWI